MGGAAMADEPWRRQPKPSGDMRCLHPLLLEWAPFLMPHTYSTYCDEALGTSHNVNHPHCCLLATGHLSGCLCAEGF